MLSLSRRKFIALGIGLACLADGARIWHVNKNAPIKIPVLHHAIGEEVKLDKTFINSIDEVRHGYSITVTDAHLSSYNDFICSYATDGTEPIEGLDYPAFVDLTWLIKNERSQNDDQNGGINAFFINLVPKRRNTYFIVLSDLVLKSQVNLRKAGSNGMTFSILPGTEYELHIPYGFNGGSQKYLGRRIKDAYLYHMEDTEFELFLSNLPVRHIVDITCK